MKHLFLVLLMNTLMVYAKGQIAGGVLHLNGVSDYADSFGTFDALTDSSDFTIELWFRKCNATPASFNLFDYKASTAGDGIDAFYSDFLGAIQVTFSGETGFQNTVYMNVPLSQEEVNNGQWKHFAITFDDDSGIARAFINGVFVLEEDSVSFVPTTGSFVLGANDLGYLWPFAGEIDEVRTSNVIRYGSNFIPENVPFEVDNHTLGLWHFDEAEGTNVFHDEVDQFAFIGNSNTTTFHLIEADNISICPGNSVLLDAHSNLLSYSWTPSTGLSATDIANPNSTPGNSITYLLTANNGMCDYEDSIHINVGNLQASINGNATICAGDTTELSACCGTTYSWTPMTGILNAESSTPLFFPTETTTYTVVVSQGENCTDTEEILLVVNPLPGASILVSEDTLCTGFLESPILTAVTDFGTFFHWGPFEAAGCENCQETAGLATETTVYTLQVTDENGCTSTAEQTIVVEECSDRVSEKNSSSIECFPNPTRDWLQIAGTNTEDVIQLYDLTGKKLGQWIGVSSLSLGSLSAGNYLLVVVSNQAVYRRQIQKQ